MTDSRGQKRSPLTCVPIGIVRSPFTEKADAPRQATAPGGGGVAGRIEIDAPYVDGLADLDGFERLWILFWFDRAEGWRSKVLPPRSDTKRGVFATRSPHRPNPIGMSAVRLEKIEGAILHVRDLDLIEGTPVLDLKPYIPYADAFPEAAAGWLDAQATDPVAGWTVDVEPAAEAAFAWIAQHGGELRTRTLATLALGPQPHAYRRIKIAPDGRRRILAVKEWRVVFRVVEEKKRIIVEDVTSGFSPRDLDKGAEAVHALHRAFLAR
jgi:tRNA (adenine37-N6)-methyltransferase